MSETNRAVAPKKTYELISRDKAVEEVRKACFGFAELYFHFAKTLVETLGEERAFEIAKEAVASRARERAEKLRDVAAEQCLDNTLENWSKVTDIPFLGWDKSLGRNHCPYAETWLKYYGEAPWFRRFALAYCSVNDPIVTEVFTGNRTSQRITKNVLAGDEVCDRVYFPYEEKSKYEKEDNDERTE